MPIAWLFCELPVEFLPLRRGTHTHTIFYAEELPPKKVREWYAPSTSLFLHTREREMNVCCFFHVWIWGGGCVLL